MSIRSHVSDIFNERTHYDFVGSRRRGFLFSAVVILIGLASLGVRGLNFGIDFEGGTAWQVEVEGRSPSTGSVRDLLAKEGLVSPQIVVLGGGIIRVQAERVPLDKQREIGEVLAGYARADIGDVSITDVGPTWGSEVSDKAVRALIFFFIAIALYMSLRFEPKMALAGLVAVVHDIFITVSAYSLTGFEVSPATVIAFLTILGFSLYDTVVVFDKIKENIGGMAVGGRETYSAVANRSMNSVLMRSLNTSISSALPVFSLLFIGSILFGALTIQGFALALGIGIIAGTYSSIFIATPVLAILKEREPRYKALRERLASRTTAPAAAVTGAGPAASGEDAAGGETEPAEVGVTSPTPRPTPVRRTGPPPRPRQQRRKRR